MGTQYRSVIYTLGPQQQAAALHSRDVYQRVGGNTRTSVGTARPPLGTLTNLPSPGVWGKPLLWLCQAKEQWDGVVYPDSLSPWDCPRS